MRILSIALLCTGVAGSLAAQQPAQPAKPVAAPKTHLKVGDPAPDFTLTANNNNQKVTLSDFKGKNTVVLAFFPAAFSPG